MDVDVPVRLLIGKLAEALNTEERRRDGVLSNDVVEPFDLPPTPDNLLHLDSVLERAEKLCLVEHCADWDCIRLTPAGWRRLGVMPGSEKDSSFLTALLDLWADPAAYRWKGRIMGSSVYHRLGWSFDDAEVNNISRRLAEQGLVERLEMQGDVLLRPGPNATESRGDPA